MKSEQDRERIEANATETPAQPERPPAKKQWMWTIIFILIAAVSVLAVVLQSREFSLSQFWSYLTEASLPWLGVSLLGMLGFIFFEGFALLIICRAFGYRQKIGHGYIYSASDIYFSAITPSATGGQPASAYFMMKDGIPGMVVTVALVANLCMYTLAIVAIGAICFTFHFDVFLSFNLVSKVLILVGVVMQLGLALFFFLLLKNGALLHRICRAVIHFLCKIRILRHEERKQAKLDASMERYRGYAHVLSGHRKTLIFVFLFNFLQRASQIAVTMFTYLASGGSLSRAGELWAMQGYVVIGSNSIPIPGAMGVSDYIMLDGFRSIMSESAAVNLELLSRSFSFYICIFLCGISTLIQFQRLKKRRTLS
ncbi:MAG: flippase-like domain-containing protein [Clostridia bacterium]|nr:flippase-like domain-containing protein [Clostridia bacterium]